VAQSSDLSDMDEAVMGCRVPGAGCRVRSQRGTTLIETVIAMGILVVVMTGLLGMSTFATSHTENQGHLGARTTEYAQDKMEQLVSLAFNDTVSDTRFFPAAPTAGTGLTIGGSSDPAAPVALYVDWLDEKGNLLASVGTTAPADWFYERVWKIEAVAGCPVVNGLCTLKRVTVTTRVRNNLGRIGGVPASTLVQIKSSPF